jgi:hypothetical protein
MNEGVFTMFEKLGIKGVRTEVGFNVSTDRAFAPEQARVAQWMDWAKKHDVTVMMTLGAGGGDAATEPLGQGRPWLSPDNVMLKTKSDLAWMPSYDDDFQNWVKGLATDYGWPKGNLNAVELWNEPWESTSISGWGADIPRYRDMYMHMAKGVIEARNDAGIKVLAGGTCSSANARDKLFSDGTEDMLPYFDFVSIHYQGLAADPSLVPAYLDRKGPYGPVRVWDTESWLANSEDRVAGVIASMRAQGQSRTAGIFAGNVYDSANIKAGTTVYPVIQAYPPAAAIAATQKFIGQRDFNQILLKNGLPWVFVFDGRKDERSGQVKAEDGTVVIVGDMKQLYEASRTLFRSVKVGPDAKMVIDDAGGKVVLFDFYGNRLASTAGKITVPLNGLGYFLRTNGSAGSFAVLLKSVKAGRITGIDPVEIVAHDLTGRTSQHPDLKITVTNMLNRPVTGKVSATLGGLKLANPASAVTIGPNESKDVEIPVEGGDEAASNIYPLNLTFDAGSDGKVEHVEDLHVNVIAKRTIAVDGDLTDWKGVLPEILPTAGIKVNMTEQAYLPYMKIDDQGVSGIDSVYLAYDDDYFYFAAKISDTTPDPGQVRFETRDDDAYFYPDEVTSMAGKKLEWPAGVRHYSYRKRMDIPSGESKHDSVQIAFNVLDKKPWLPYPAGTEPRFITYWDTDYEYALNTVSPQYGGGVELWRLLAPGVPQKEHYPRQPASAIDQGPVKNGKLVIRQEGNTRIVESAIPWSEIPEVHKRILAGQTIKFTARVNDNGSAPRELGTERSVSKANQVTFHDSWQTHWSNELEFAPEKK